MGGVRGLVVRVAYSAIWVRFLQLYLFVLETVQNPSLPEIRRLLGVGFCVFVRHVCLKFSDDNNS